MNERTKFFTRYRDGRIVAHKSKAGRQWYGEQTVMMAQRQGWWCGLIPSGECKLPIRAMDEIGIDSAYCATFEHGDKRGMGGSRRNDDIDAPGNCAAHLICNLQLGSRRIK